MQNAATDDDGLRRIVLIVALLNLGYGVFEFGIASTIGSVSLFADSVDFFEDAFVNLLIFFALAWSMQRRAQAGMVMAGVLLVPGLATLWTLFEKLQAPIAPDPLTLGLTGLGALGVNLFCAFLLARYKMHSGSLTKAAFLSARNDAFANVAIITAGLITALIWRSAWPDIVVGLAIAWMNLDAAKEVWEAARREQEQAKA
ncbi:MAG: cation transporter [Bosea sp. (in: a-proteobacteria)]